MQTAGIERQAPLDMGIWAVGRRGVGWVGRRKEGLLLRLLSRGMEIWRCRSPLVMH